MSVRDVMRLIEADGWLLAATRGSHRRYEHPSEAGRVTIAGKPSDDGLEAPAPSSMVDDVEA